MVYAYVLIGRNRYAVAIQEMATDEMRVSSFTGEGGWEEASGEVLRRYPGDVVFVLSPGDRFEAIVETGERTVRVVSAPELFEGLFERLRRRLE